MEAPVRVGLTVAVNEDRDAEPAESGDGQLAEQHVGEQDDDHHTRDDGAAVFPCSRA